MTRINVGIDPIELIDKHLLAEHREIKRIPNTILSGRAIIKDIPKKFTLGKGHVKFFYNKIGYLFLRYVDIRNECWRRGFNITNYSKSFWKIRETRSELWNFYDETKADRELVLERIKSKIIA